MEVFSSQGSDPAGKWKLQGPVRKEYDKPTKSFVFVLEGGNSTSVARMQLPKSEKSTRKAAVCVGGSF